MFTSCLRFGCEMATVTDSGEEAGQKRFGPAWLRLLLGATFFEPCPMHLGVAKNECNHYCLDCIDKEGTTTIFCSICFADHTDHHHVLQIRRSSYHEVVRVAELEAVVDISLVQTYVINGDKVVFLNARPMALGHGTKCVGPAGACLECGRGLIDAAFRFCSLGCKLEGMTSDHSLTFALDPIQKQAPVGEAEGDLPGPSKLQKTGQTSYRRRPRKGVHRKPERAPFF